MGRLRRVLLPAGFLLLLPLGLFGRALLTARTLDYDDLGYWFFPWKALLYRQAHQGGLTFWLPWEFCGMPQVADIQRQIFYPPNAVFYVLPTWAAMVVFVAFHFAVAGLLMYGFLRRVERPEPVSPVAAVCGGVAYAFSAFPVLHLTQLPMLASYTWIPGLLASVELYWRSAGRGSVVELRGLVLGSLFLALMVLGGAPQMVYIGATLAFVYALLLAVRSRRAVAPGRVMAAVLAMAVVPVLAAMLCALQLLPMAELSARSSRQLKVPDAYSTIDTDPPYMLASFLTPYVWGNPMAGTWTGQPYAFHEQCFYVGLVTLVLAGAALGDFRRRPMRTVFFLAAALAGVLISLGNYVGADGVGLHDVLRAILPMFGKFRVPARWMVWTSTGAAVLAAFGVDALARYRPPRERRGFRGLGPHVGACAAVGLCGSAALVMARQQPATAREDELALFLLALALAACVLARRGAGPASLAAVLLTGLVALDLGGFAARYVQLSPASRAVLDVPVLRTLRDHLPGVYRIATHPDVRIPTSVATWCPYYGVHNVQGTNPLYLERYLEYLYYSQAGRVPPISDLAGLMHHDGFFVVAPVLNAMTDMLDLRYAVVVAPGHRRDAAITVRSLAVAKLGGHPVGEAICVHDFAVEPDRGRLLAAMLQPDWDPRRLVYFSARPTFVPGGPPGPVRSRVSVRELRGDSLEVGVNADRDCFVVFSEMDYPGWRAWVDGREVSILRADDLFRAVPLTPGSHTVVMRYEPGAFRGGLAVTGAALIVLAGMTVMAWRRR